MIRSILVPLDESPWAATALQAAVQVARPVDAELVGLHVVDIKILHGPLLRDLAFGAESFAGFEYREDVSRALEEKGRRILAEFARGCDEAGIRHSELLETGIVSETIARVSHRTDLVVMGKRGENGEWASAFLGSVVEQTVRASSRAVIVIPAEVRPIRRILVAYDGSQNANRAIAMLKDLAGLGEFEIRVLTVAGSGEDVSAPMQEGVEYLNARGLPCEGLIREGDPVEEIVRATGELEVDILVMGAFGQSRLRSLLLGSTTTQVLRRVEVPVLLYR